MATAGVPSKDCRWLNTVGIARFRSRSRMRSSSDSAGSRRSGLAARADNTRTRPIAVYGSRTFQAGSWRRAAGFEASTATRRPRCALSVESSQPRRHARGVASRRVSHGALANVGFGPSGTGPSERRSGGSPWTRLPRSFASDHRFGSPRSSRKQRGPLDPRCDPCAAGGPTHGPAVRTGRQRCGTVPDYAEEGPGDSLQSPLQRARQGSNLRPTD